MNLPLWDILTLLIYVAFPVGARIFLQRGKAKKPTERPGFALFAGSILFGVGVGLLCGLSERLAPTKEIAAAVMGWMAPDVSVWYSTQAAYYRRNPRALRAMLLGFLARIFNNTKKPKK